MTNGYSVRYAKNYSRKTDGTWKLHSGSIWDEKGYTKTWPTIEAAERAAIERMSHITDPTERNYVQYCKIYHGKEYIKTVNRK